MSVALSADTRVLVVDDSPSIRAVFESHLRRLGFRDVRTAATVDEAIRVFREQEPRLVFLDLVIDEASGLDFATVALEEKPFTIIVVVTALPRGHEDVVSAFAEGAQEYLPKPARFGAVKEVVDHLGRLDAQDRDHEAPDYV